MDPTNRVPTKFAEGSRYLVHSLAQLSYDVIRLEPIYSTYLVHRRTISRPEWYTMTIEYCLEATGIPHYLEAGGASARQRHYHERPTHEHHGQDPSDTFET